MKPKSVQIFLLLGFLVGFSASCTRIEQREIPRLREEAPRTRANLRGEADFYTEFVDVMVAFLWPETLTTDLQRDLLNGVLANSREIVRKKKLFQTTKAELLRDFSRHQCECAINQVCTGEETESNTQLCYSIEDAIYVNDSLLVEVYGLVEKVRAGILGMGGEWIDTHLDLNGAPSPQMSFLRSEIIFSTFGSYESDGKRKPLSYPPVSIQIETTEREPRFQLRFPRLLWNETDIVPSGEWRIEGGIAKTDSSLLFQGDLLWESPSGVRRGMIYWENPRKN